jgi:hypothetical protein
LRQLGVGSLSRKALRVGGKGKGSTPRQLFASEAIAVKSRDISDTVRGANHLPDLESRRSAMMPRGAASVSWGAHRMEYADGVADRSHLSARKL